jgi:hypothetical protein
MTEPGGPAWRQTTFFPFAAISAFAVGRAVDVQLQSDSYETTRYGTVPKVDAVAAWNDETGIGGALSVPRPCSAGRRAGEVSRRQRLRGVVAGPRSGTSALSGYGA